MRKILQLLGASTLVLTTLSAIGQEYPSKPVRLIVQYAAGSVVDTIARSIGEGMSKELRQPIVIENRPGASGLIAFQYVARQPPDGYTIGLGDSSMAVLPLFMKTNERMDILNELPPFTGVVEMASLLAAPSAVGWKSYEEMLAFAKANPKKLNFAIMGLQTPTMIGAEIIRKKAGIDMALVPYAAGAPEIRQALTRGDVQLAFYTEVMAAGDVGKVKILAVSGDRRLRDFPDAPTFKELGLGEIEGYVVTLNAPAGTSTTVLDKLRAALRVALEQVATAERFAKFGLAPAASSAESIRAKMAATLKSNTEIARRISLPQN